MISIWPRICDWCGGDIPEGMRSDARFCRTPCRQAAHRVDSRRAQLHATDRPLRLAIADPPYVGMSRRYYGAHPDYQGEVDHRALLSRLATYDGWALACSSRSIPDLAAIALDLNLDPLLAIWHRRRPWSRATRYEGVLYVPARLSVDSSTRTTDVLLDVDARQRPTLPASVIGMKPPAWAVWVFGLLGARAGDDLDDLYPGSGLVARAWAEASRVAAPD